MSRTGVSFKEFPELLKSHKWPHSIDDMQRVMSSGFTLFKEWVEEKNRAFFQGTPGEKDRFSHVGLRYDYAECHSDIRELMDKFKTKFIYCMRDDIGALYISQRKMHQISSFDRFKAQIEESHRAIRELKAEGYDICPSNVGHSAANFKRLDKFLGLPPSPYQLLWQDLNPRTNATDPGELGEDPMDSISLESLTEMYQQTWEELT
jgi:hypothetical protein